MVTLRKILPSDSIYYPQKNYDMPKILPGFEAQQPILRLELCLRYNFDHQFFYKRH